jgi:hypothetical protein
MITANPDCLHRRVFKLSPEHHFPNHHLAMWFPVFKDVRGTVQAQASLQVPLVHGSLYTHREPVEVTIMSGIARTDAQGLVIIVEGGPGGDTFGNPIHCGLSPAYWLRIGTGGNRPVIILPLLADNGAAGQD